MSEADGARDIVDLGLGLPDTWHQVSLDEESPEAWAQDLCSRLLPEGGTAAGMLGYQLARVCENLRGTDVPGLTAAVWVPAPESGYVASAFGFHLGTRAPGDTAEAVAGAFAEDLDTADEDGTRYLEVNPWSGTVEAGPFAAVRHLLSHQAPDEIEGWIEERALYVVFPPGAAQTVELFFSAENIGSFWDIATQTQEIVETLDVRLGDAA